MKRTDGFTLVELMIVIVIIGILATIALPKYSTAIAKAVHADAMGITAPIQKDIAEFYGYHGRLPKDNAELNLPEPDSLCGTHVKRIEINSGTIYITFEGAREDVAKDSVIFTPEIIDPRGNAIVRWNLVQYFSSSKRYTGKDE